MECTHKRVEEMYGIKFCADCGEEVGIMMGQLKGSFWKHGKEPKKKMTDDEKLQRDMFAYNFPYEVTVKAIKLYKHYLDTIGKNVKGRVCKTIAFGCFYVAFVDITGGVGDVNNVLQTVGIKKKSGQRGLNNVVTTIGGKDKYHTF